MIRKLAIFFLIASASLNLTGCFSGRTSVVASQYSSKPYDIYLNGRQVCRMGGDEECTFQTRGTRAGGLLEAYLDGQRVGSINIHRTVSFATILWAIPTYGAALFLYKAYPDEIEIPIDTYVLRNGNNNYGYSKQRENNEYSGSVWDRPFTTKKTKKAEIPVSPTETEVSPQETVESNVTEATSSEPFSTKKSIWD